MIAFWISAAVWLVVLAALVVRAALDAADGRLGRFVLAAVTAVVIFTAGMTYLDHLAEVPS